jgi:hypothetical protein
MRSVDHGCYLSAVVISVPYRCGSMCAQPDCMKSLIALFLSASLSATALVGCATGDNAADNEEALDGGDGKADGPVVTWSSSIKFIVPKEMHEYLEKGQWGDYHMNYHMSRKFWAGGQGVRDFLTRMNEKYAERQEGDSLSGLDFLVMHHAMIEHLGGKFGTLAIAGSEDGFLTVADMLKGWDSDEKVIAKINSVGGNTDRFTAAAAAVKADQFASLDALGLYIQTSLRTSPDVDPNDTFIRTYTQDQTPGAGIHNALHGIFQDPRSPVNVGNPQTNLSNQRFWGIHGWVESLYVNYLKAHPLSAQEQADHDQMLAKYRLHMQLHSDPVHSEHSADVPHASRAFARANASKMFANIPLCADVDKSVKIDHCL